jgi:outer membrane immunogenic protein
MAVFGRCALGVAVEANMRLLVRGLLLAGVASPAFAADIDNSWLRGSSSFPADPPPFQRWSGVYGGGQVGADFRGVDFRSVVGDSITNISGQDANFNGVPLNSFPHLSTVNTKGPSYGGFIGYNYQIDDVVLGLELNFNQSSVNASLSDPESHSYFVNANGKLYAATYNVNTNASAMVADYGTVRARGGWAYGNFLPYVFAGVSVAQVNTSRSVNVNYHSCTVTSTGCDPTPPTIGGTYTLADVSHGKWIYGFDTGLGIDYAVTRNVFLRGEVEYIQIGDPNNIKINNASARAGLGLKF